jgi:hypothetical protein
MSTQQHIGHGQSGRCHVDTPAHGSWLVWRALCQRNNIWPWTVWQASCWHSSTWIMASLTGVMSTQQHMEHGQSGRRHVNTVAHGSWSVWQASCQHSSTWVMASLAGIMSTQQHMDHLYTTPPGLQLLEALHNWGCGIFFQARWSIFLDRRPTWPWADVLPLVIDKMETFLTIKNEKF